MKDFWKKYRIVLAISGFFLIVLPLSYWSSSYVLKKIEMKADSIQEEILDNNFEKSKIDKIPEMESVNDEFEKNKDAVGTILNSGSKVDFIKYIESLAEETNNKVELKVLEDDNVENKSDANAQNKAVVKKETTPGSEGEKSIKDSLLFKQYISMQVDMTGDYASFLNFVHKLENNRYYVNIISFDLKKAFVKKDSSPQENQVPVSSGGIFLSPGNQINPVKVDNPDGDPILKSSLNIIIYTE